MTDKRATPEELAREAKKWANGTASLKGWADATTAAPRHGESTAISVRMPTKMLAVLRELARREGIGYQVLMKRWLEERLRSEAQMHLDRLRAQRREVARAWERELLKHRPEEIHLGSGPTSPVFTKPKQAA